VDDAPSLPPAVLDELRARLLAERRRLANRAAAILADAEDERWTPDRGDPHDRAAAERIRQALARRSEADARLLAEIDAALERMDAGTYGICEDTGEPIPLARLRAIPWARYLAEVQAQFEGADRAAAAVAPDPDEGYS